MVLKVDLFVVKREILISLLRSLSDFIHSFVTNHVQFLSVHLTLLFFFFQANELTFLLNSLLSSDHC